MILRDLVKYMLVVLLIFVLLIAWGVAARLDAAEDLVSRGIAEYRAESYEEALETLTRAKKQQAGSSTAAYYLGLTYKQMGDYPKAVENFKDAVKLNPPVSDAYLELADVLYQLNDLKESKEWIAKAERYSATPGPVAYLKGLILSKEGRSEDAMAAFKKATELDRSLAQASNLQSAMLSARERKFDEAKEQLRTIATLDPTSDFASFAKEYENALTKNLEAYKAWRFTAGLAYQYDDNVVAKPSAAIGLPAVDLITGARDSSIVGTFRTDFTPILNRPWIFSGQYAFYNNSYSHTKSHDLKVHSVSLIPGGEFQRGTITVPLSVSRIWLGDKRYSNTFSLRPTLSMVVVPGHIGQLAAGYGTRNMIQLSDPDEDRDARIYTLSAGYIYPFSDGKGVLNIRYEFSREKTVGKNWENKGNRLTGSLLVPLRESVSLSISGDVFFQNYRNDTTNWGSPGFPDEPTKRKDRIYSASAGLIWELPKGFNLNIQYAHTRADSNFAVYDYKRNIYTVGLEYSF